MLLLPSSFPEQFPHFHFLTLRSLSLLSLRKPSRLASTGLTPTPSTSPQPWNWSMTWPLLGGRTGRAPRWSPWTRRDTWRPISRWEPSQAGRRWERQWCKDCGVLLREKCIKCFGVVPSLDQSDPNSRSTCSPRWHLSSAGQCWLPGHKNINGHCIECNKEFEGLA